MNCDTYCLFDIWFDIDMLSVIIPSSKRELFQKAIDDI